jgi:hypothetical protein
MILPALGNWPTEELAHYADKSGIENWDKQYQDRDGDDGKEMTGIPISGFAGISHNRHACQSETDKETASITHEYGGRLKIVNQKT